MAMTSQGTADIADTSPASGRAGRHLGRAATVFLATGLLLIALNLRIGVASVSPVIRYIQDALGLTSTTAGLLSTLPVLCFGIFAFLTPWLVRRIGIDRLLAVVLVVLAVAIATRLVDGSPALFIGTVFVGAAIAVGNVVLPAAIKQHFVARTGLMMSLYSMTLYIGAALASGLTVPLMHAFDGDWQAALAIWSIPAAVALLVWLPRLWTTRRASRRSGTESAVSQADSAESASVADVVPERDEPSFSRLIRDRTALAVTGFMGLQSLSYYAGLAWVPTILTDHGMSSSTAGLMLSYSSFPALASALLVPILANRVSVRWIPAAMAVGLTALALAGLVVAPVSGAIAWMTLLGLGQGAALSLALSYIVWRAPDARHTAHLSTMAQGVGYLVAALGPFLVGALHSVTGGWQIPLAVLIVLLVPELVAGVIASRNRHVLTPVTTE